MPASHVDLVPADHAVVGNAAAAEPDAGVAAAVDEFAFESELEVAASARCAKNLLVRSAPVRVSSDDGGALDAEHLEVALSPGERDPAKSDEDGIVEKFPSGT